MTGANFWPVKIEKVAMGMAQKFAGVLQNIQKSFVQDMEIEIFGQ